MSITFVTGCARSGTTSLLELVGSALGIDTRLEPLPDLGLESRLLYENRLGETVSSVVSTIAPRVARGLETQGHYAEKNVSLVPFIPHLATVFNCRFLVPIRFGPDVVASIMNWHSQMYPLFYQECGNALPLSEHARQVLEQQNGFNGFDLSLPRPGPHDPYHQPWPDFSRFEKIIWYWAFVNRRLFQELEKLDSSRYLVVDYSDLDVAKLISVLDFIDAPKPYDMELVHRTLADKVNSLSSRAGSCGEFPQYDDWSESEKQRFTDIAFDTSKLLGYESSTFRPRPPGFGSWWKEDAQNEDWYREIYEYRSHSHQVFKDWFSAIDSDDSDCSAIESIIDIGCGIGYGYTDFFQNKNYTGIDLIEKSVNLCNANNTNSKHGFLCADIIEEQLDLRADLVLSQGSIDNVYDMDGFLRKLCRLSDKYIYINNYRGYFHGIENHRNLWDPTMRVSFNDISARRTREILKSEGFATVLVFPQQSFREDIKVETTIIASRAEVDPETLFTQHAIGFEFSEYSATERNLPVLEPERPFSRCPVKDDPCVARFDPSAEIINLFERLGKEKSRKVGTYHNLVSGRRGINTCIKLVAGSGLKNINTICGSKYGSRVPTTVYFDHLGRLYGTMEGNQFVRNTAMISVYRQLQKNKNEIALYFDPVALVTNYGIDPSNALDSEVSWMRDNGFQIKTVGIRHISVSRDIPPGLLLLETHVESPDFVELNDVYIPFQGIDILSLPDINLDRDLICIPYTEIFNDQPGKSKDWFRSVFQTSSGDNNKVDYQIILLGQNCWVIGGRDRKMTDSFSFFHAANLDSVMSFLQGIGKRNSVCISAVV